MSDLPPMTSIKRWLVTTNHKDVGILYLATALFFLLFGGVMALAFRAHLWEMGGTGLLDGDQFNQAVTAHGLLMVFWFLSPFAAGFANYFVPLQIGADDLAFPRLNALSYWFYLFSGILIALSFFQGGTFSGGWTMYAPLNVPTYTPAMQATTGGNATIFALALFVISITIGTVNFLVTIHRSRAEGLGLWNMPLFTWSWLLTVWMMLFAFAALLAAVLLQLSDRVFLTQYFATDQGSSLLWAHLFWFFGHPEVYIVFFPALGIMFEVFQTFTGRRLVGRKWVIIAMVLVALQSFLVWMHHMFLTTINLEIKTLMMATTIGISLPFDLMVFALIYTMVKGRIRFTTPFLFSLGALVLFILGGITGVFLGAVVLDYEFRGTYWVVAHFHYVMVSGVTALIGGLYYWWPKITGKMYSEALGKLNFAVYFVGFNLLYFPQFLAWETPRRVFHFAEGAQFFHRLSTVGAFVFGASFLIMFYTFAKSWVSGPDAPDNPWEYSRTAEWAIPSPPPLENWGGRPSYASGRLEFVDDTSAATDGGVAQATEVHEEEHADHASIWPFGIGVGTFVFFLGLSGITPYMVEFAEARGHSLVGSAAEPNIVYPILTVLGVVTLGYTLFKFGLEEFNVPQPAVAESWPFSGVGNTKLGVWVFLASDVMVFGAIIGGFVFLRLHMGWHNWETIPFASWPGLLNTYILLTSSFTVILALVFAERQNKRGLLGAMSATLLLALTFMGVKAYEYNYKFSIGEYWWTSIEHSVYFVTTGLHALHVILGVLIAVFMIYRIVSVDAYLEDHRPVEFFGLYWHFVDIVWVFLFPLFYLM
ncbi:cbb3-type cytochrome c oxidase subunit I [Natronobacterium gregoryi]|uniref:Cytochrome C oxidase subunit I n=2 Tax=Natronobacterium gregoryi TaxID=44930 RepID=L0AE22_NATGS|nr:cbb3-type cytochrome c oxidase subunit I [Natronobacterium gregoryi]AFZ71402.1 heme/copper-type cytochrome/quinol oxidase, subunit 1 [Natronobacterium gregoryi SP2]ELY66927.1 cytochrome C oxidase subunit I [Natronobacterium gregoryi SP2]PLK21219.1 cytochrome C oxidase subunit I [Natronobacterium gregoryi SP2]SFI84549.1 cytochrome c oxidase subunit I+III [Natronobacterium gregoryi]